jgi:hypothetical protein
LKHAYSQPGRRGPASQADDCKRHSFGGARSRPSPLQPHDLRRRRRGGGADGVAERGQTYVGSPDPPLRILWQGQGHDTLEEQLRRWATFYTPAITTKLTSYKTATHECVCTEAHGMLLRALDKAILANPTKLPRLLPLAQVAGPAEFNLPAPWRAKLKQGATVRRAQHEAEVKWEVAEGLYHAEPPLGGTRVPHVIRECCPQLGLVASPDLGQNYLGQNRAGGGSKS